MIRFSQTRLILGLLALLPLCAALPAHAQTTATCSTYTTPCVVNGVGGQSIIIGGTAAQPSTISPNANGQIGGELNIFGSGDSITDLNTQANVLLGNTQIFGSYNSFAAAGANSSIVGYYNSVNGVGGASIYGSNNTVNSDDGHIVITGDVNTVTGTQGQNLGISVIGGSNTITASSGSVLGTLNTVTDATKTSVTGYFNTMSGDSNTIMGNGNVLSGSNSAIVGNNSSSDGLDGAMIVGSNSHLGPDATGSIILGSNTSTDTANQAAFGGRTLGQIGNGVAPDDGVALNQLNSAMQGFGAGASFVDGVYTAPTFILTAPGAAGTYRDTNTALLALDNGLNDVNTRIDNLPPGGNGPAGPAGPQGPTGPQGPAGTNGTDGTNGTGTGTDPNAVHYDAGSNDSSVTLQGANGTTISNVAPGEVSATSTDAINGSQLYAAEQTAKTYTDTQVQKGEDWAKSYTDHAVAGLSRRIDDSTAMGTAMSQQVATFAGANPNNRNRVAAGMGFAGGRAAISIGYQHVSRGGHMSWNVGAAVGQDDKTTIGAGMGFSW
jgi:hypothetical protein